MQSDQDLYCWYLDIPKNENGQFQIIPFFKVQQVKGSKSCSIFTEINKDWRGNYYAIYRPETSENYKPESFSFVGDK